MFDYQLVVSNQLDSFDCGNRSGWYGCVRFVKGNVWIVFVVGIISQDIHCGVKRIGLVVGTYKGAFKVVFTVIIAILNSEGTNRLIFIGFNGIFGRFPIAGIENIVGAIDGCLLFGLNDDIHFGENNIVVACEIFVEVEVVESILTFCVVVGITEIEVGDVAIVSRVGGAAFFALTGDGESDNAALTCGTQSDDDRCGFARLCVSLVVVCGGCLAAGNVFAYIDRRRCVVFLIVAFGKFDGE